MVYRGSYLSGPTHQRGQQVIAAQIQERPSITIPKAANEKRPIVRSEPFRVKDSCVNVSRIAVLIVSTKYARKLRLVLEACAKSTSIVRILVATDSKDLETQRVLAEFPTVEPHFVNFSHMGSTFDKGCALKTLQTHVHLDTTLDAILILDSDIVLPDTFDSLLGVSKFQKGHLYGPRTRFLVYSQTEFETNMLSRRDFPKFSSIIGFFQMYTKPFLHTYEHSKNASACDMEFANKWNRTKQHRLQVDVVHLGRINTNWNGLQREDFQWNS